MVTSFISAFVLGSTLMSLTSAKPTPELSQNGSYLRRLSDQSVFDDYHGDGPFVDATETAYYDFSMAWRFLGFYMDCNVCVEVGEDKGDDDANNNEGDDEKEKVVTPSECLQNGEDRTVCRRYALWAAYVDESYEGKGPNEYQHFDRRTKRWDQSGCSSSEERCAKLDCHDPSSQNFKLVGVFKDHQTDAFIDNMIHYQGDCVWNDDEYKFMKAMNSNNNNNNNNNHSLLPTKCTAYEVEGKGGKVYAGYYNTIPTQKGNLGVALYTDSSCTIPYEGKEHSPQEVVARALGSSSSDMEGQLKSWNEAMDAFKICQPCVAYNTIMNDPKKPYNANGDRYEQNDADGGEDQEGDENEDSFVCQDNLERDEPINQCKVFTEQGKNSMAVASYQDILLAESQGTVTGIDLSPNGKRRGKMVMGKSFVESRHTWLSILFLLLSLGFFGYALGKLFQKDRSKYASNRRDLKKPLVYGENEKSRERKEEAKRKSPSKSILKKPKKGEEEDDECYSYCD